ncbi:hypothetical protein [Mesobacillus sp.]|uniref:hypothetical protein n=1 Tax=Mesobacillus sp. TaxID=2675271 RepID=UPI0039EFC58B
MGFYYFIILFTGIFLVLRAGLYAFKNNSLFKSRVIVPGLMGILFIGLSLYLFTPGSSDTIAELLRMNE